MGVEIFQMPFVSYATGQSHQTAHPDSKGRAWVPLLDEWNIKEYLTFFYLPWHVPRS